MSFLAVFNVDGARVDGETIGATEEGHNILCPSRQIALRWRVSNADQEWKDARHAVELDGRFWLLGRIRLDRRDTLCSLLAASKADSDALLCLRAYAHWGEDCVERLYGDFCFVIWDERQRRLFCARDQLGVRPLFHARSGATWFVGDSLDAVARQSGLTDDLDEFWVADFLTGPYCLDIDRTVYKHVKRLAPAHTLVLSEDGVVVRKYWSFDLKEPIYYRRPSQYIDHFHHVVARAIKDRLPDAGFVGVSMSGGLDSTTLAAKTVEIAGDASRVVAFTNVFERLIPDQEAHFSALAARRLGIAHRIFAVDSHIEYQASDLLADAQEPGGASVCRRDRRAVDIEMARRAKVWFFGEGPDNALAFEWRAHLQWLARRNDWRRLISTVAQYIRGKELGEWLMTIKKLRSPPQQVDAVPWMQLPEWLDREFVESLNLMSRAENAMNRLRRNDSWRPDAVASFASPIWQSYFEVFDPVLSGYSLDARHPYADLEVLTFMLRTPPIPWGRRKLLMRRAMTCILPDEVLMRDKAPLAGDPRT
ncbi:MAG: asparagine synthase-related protein, partial [Methylocystis sp.]